MLTPSRKNRSLFEVMTDPFDILTDIHSAIPKPAPSLMKTDIKETAKAYEIAIDIPGSKKEEVSVELKDGYLTISAIKESNNEESSEDGTYIRKERFSGKSSRAFYVGEEIAEENIKAKFDNGVLLIDVPKKEILPKIEEKKTITIE